MRHAFKGVTFKELQVGQEFESMPVTVTEAHIVLFGGLIGNWHPSHLNDEFAGRAHFGKRVCHGELTSALMVSYSAYILFDTSLGQLGGSYTLKKPVLVGDTIYTEWEVLTMRPSKSRPGGIVSFGLKTYNQHGTLIAEGTADFLVGNDRRSLYSPETPAGAKSSSE